VAQIWAQGLTGVFRSRTVSGRAVVVKGEPRDGQDRNWLDDAIRRGPVQFTPATAFSSSSRLSIADTLWGLACELGSTGTLQLSRHGVLIDGLAAPGIMRLPLSTPVRTLLESRTDASEDLEGLLQRSQVDRDAVWFELAALIALGALKLRFPAGSKPYDVLRPDSEPHRPSPKPPPTPPPPPPPPPQPSKPAAEMAAPPSPPGSENAALADEDEQDKVLKRLEREWAVIEDANDHVVLGITPQMDEETLASACQRMEQRYRKLAEDESLSEPSRELAQRILDRVEVAIERVQQGEASGFAGDPFEQGKAAAAQREWDTALKLFALARSQSDNPLYRAWFGWAMYNDPSRPVETRRTKGREHMDLADNIVANSEAALLLAQADVMEGELVHAWNRLERLVKEQPQNAAARQMLIQVQKDVRKI